MKRTTPLILLAACGASVAWGATRTAPALRLQTVNYRGWDGCRALVAGPYRVVVAPALGGRIMEYSRHGVGPLWNNPAELGKPRPSDPKQWWNTGGFKNWPAPQSRWGWPPDSQLDAAPATVTPWMRNGRLYGMVIIGQESRASGIAFTRHLRLDPQTGRLRLVQTMRALPMNTAPVAWSVWGIAQVDAAGIVATPLNPRSRFPNGIHFYDDKAKASKAWSKHGDLMILHNLGEPLKWGADTDSGWMAWLKGRQAFVMRFPRRLPGRSYPDEESVAQVYTNDKVLPYTEMEVVGPMVTLRPGEATTVVNEWRLIPLPKAVGSVADAPGAVAALRKGGHLRPFAEKPVLPASPVPAPAPASPGK